MLTRKRSSKVVCPKCESSAVKNGTDSGKQRYRCTSLKCRCNFRISLPTAPSNHEEKRKCMIMRLSGASVQEIRLALSSVNVNISEQTIKRWIKKYGSSLKPIINSNKKCVFQELAVIDGELFRRKKNNIFENDIHEIRSGLVIIEKKERTIISPLDKDYAFFHEWKTFLKNKETEDDEFDI